MDCKINTRLTEMGRDLELRLLLESTGRSWAEKSLFGIDYFMWRARATKLGYAEYSLNLNTIPLSAVEEHDRLFPVGFDEKNARIWQVQSMSPKLEYDLVMKYDQIMQCCLEYLDAYLEWRLSYMDVNACNADDSGTNSASKKRKFSD